MKLKSLQQKVLLILCGLIVAVLLGELFFRIAGLIVDETKVTQLKDNSYRILCIGDSSTFGFGASDAERFSYPAQLQRILKEKETDRKFEVINLGIPGISSSQVLNRLRRNISEYDPDMIIVMVGINDPWNLEESNILKFYNDKGGNVAKEIFVRLELLLNKSKFYRFLMLVFLSNEFEKINIPSFNNRTRIEGFTLSSLTPSKAEALYKSITNNIFKMKIIADDYGVDIMFMKYHNVGWGRPEIAIHHVYTKLKIPVVDNETLFIKAEERGLDVRGNDGWHPNDLGYKIIAKNVYNKMVSSGFIDGEIVEIFK